MKLQSSQSSSDTAQPTDHAGTDLFQAGISLLTQHQTATGAVVSAIPGRLDEGLVDPIVHCFAIRGLLAGQMRTDAKQALIFLLSCVRTPDDLLLDCYRDSQEPDQQAAPSVDATLEAVITCGYYLDQSSDRELIKRYLPVITRLVHAVEPGVMRYRHGSLLPEYQPDPEDTLTYGWQASSGIDLLTNARAVAAYRAIGQITKTVEEDAYQARQYTDQAESIQKGILAYLRLPSQGGFQSVLMPSTVAMPMPARAVDRLMLSWYTQLPFEEGSDGDTTADQTIGGRQGHHLLETVLRYSLTGSSKALKTLRAVARANPTTKDGLPEEVVPQDQAKAEEQLAKQLDEVFPEEDLTQLYQIPAHETTADGQIYRLNPSVAVLALFCQAFAFWQEHRPSQSSS